MRKIISMILCVILIVSAGVIPVSAQTQSVLLTGKCGENLTYVCYDDYTLEITGTGDMATYDYYENVAPWYDVRKSITSVKLGDGVTSISQWAFFECTSLISYEVTEQNANFSSLDGVLFNNDKTTLLAYPMGRAGEYTVPNTVTYIGARAFADSANLTSVIIPDTVVSMDHYAFRGCTSLANVQLSNNLTDLNYQVLYNCPSLKSLVIPKSVKVIAFESFAQYYDSEKDTYLTVEDFTIYGYADSFAETYAKAEKFNFVIIDEDYGDVNNDGKVSVLDARTMLVEIANDNISDTTLHSADFNADDEITVKDARLLLVKIANG